MPHVPHCIWAVYECACVDMRTCVRTLIAGLGHEHGLWQLLYLAIQYACLIKISHIIFQALVVLKMSVQLTCCFVACTLRIHKGRQTHTDGQYCKCALKVNEWGRVHSTRFTVGVQSNAFRWWYKEHIHVFTYHDTKLAEIPKRKATYFSFKFSFSFTSVRNSWLIGSIPMHNAVNLALFTPLDSVVHLQLVPRS